MSPPTPATLPTLLRSGTGVLDAHGNRGVWVERIGEHGPGVAWETGELVTDDPSNFTLDLDSPTSRAHLAWWILAQPGMQERRPHHIVAGHFVADIRRAADACGRNWPVSAAQLDILTTVARRLAGLETV